MMEGTFIYALLLTLVSSGSVYGQTCRPNAPRSDCGYFGINQQQCESKGCCWVPTQGQPWCFFKTSAADSYQVDSVTNTNVGLKLTLKAAGSTSTQFGDLITPLAVDVTMETTERLHVKIYDPNNKRWEIPSDVSPVGEVPTSAPTDTLYKFDTAKGGEMFYFAVTRGKQSSNSSELERVLMRRRPDATGQLGPIKERPHLSRSSSSASDELASHLRRRSQAIEESERLIVVEQNKPEFMKVNLRRTSSNK